ncbi:MAG: stage II sporulation protein M [Gammaproteobacteria bacterium]
MNQQQFVSRFEPRWEKLESWLDDDKRRRGKPDGVIDDTEFPHLYREVCHHLGLARARLYSRELIRRLETIVLTAHQRLYKSRANFLGRAMEFAVAKFPHVVRREWRLVLLASLLFYGPMVVMGVGQNFYPDLIYSLLDDSQVSMIESMYNPQLTERVGREREAESDFYMFGFYIRNNTSIGFQTFAGGLLFGLGTLFYLIFNGVFIGVIGGHLTAIGYGTPFWTFVAGHSALELTAITLSGAAGLRLGMALIDPGQLSRTRALREAGRIAVRIVFGAAAMFFLAAFVEAFWSSIAWLEPGVKYAVGGLLWVVVLAYFAFLGRTRREA